MIYTVTLNPSLDYMVSVEDFKVGKTNRTSYEQMLLGGKGLNVSMVLKNLGIESTALGFVGGFVGEEISRKVEEVGIRSEFVSLKQGNSRINVKLISIDGTEINAKGPEVDTVSLKQFMDKLDMLVEDDILVLGGSIPKLIPESIYKDIIRRIYHKNICVIVDAEKHVLTDTLEFHPFLIKPNRQELNEIFNVKIKTRQDAVVYAKKLKEQGARNVLVSFGGEGALLVTEDDDIYMADAPVGDVMNSVGAGDSMVAGFLQGWMKSKDYVHALKMAVACGSASAFSEQLAKKRDVERLYKHVAIYKNQ